MAHLHTAIWLAMDPVFSNFFPQVSVIMSCWPSLHLRSVGSAYCGPFSSVQTIVQWVRHTSPPAYSCQQHSRNFTVYLVESAY